MVVLDVGLNRVRDIVDDDLTDGLAGTATTELDVAQTALTSPVAATEANVTTVKTDKTITVTYLMTPVTGNGNTYYEWLLRMNGDATAFSRVLTAGVAKTADTQISKVTTIYFDRV